MGEASSAGFIFSYVEQAVLVQRDERKARRRRRRLNHSQCESVKAVCPRALQDRARRRLCRQITVPTEELVIFLRSAVFLLLGCAPSAAQSHSPYGIWARGDGNARVRFEPCAVKEWVRPGTGDKRRATS